MLMSELKDNVTAMPIEFNEIAVLEKIITTDTWSCGVFKDNKRNKANFLSASLIALDIDEGMSIAEAKLAFAKYTHIIAPTKSHQVEKNGVVCDRFRVVLVLEDTITNAEDFEATWYSLKEICPAADDACKDASRMYYASKSIASVNRRALRVPIVKAKPKPVVEVKSSVIRGELAKDTCVFMIKGAKAGHRHHSLVKACLDYKQQGYTQDEFITALETMIQVNKGSWATDYVNEKDHKTIDDIFNNREVKHPPRVKENAFSLTSIGDIMAKKIEVTWIVDGLLTEGGFSVIAGPPKSGKSTLTRQLARSISRGIPFLGRKVTQGPVVYLALEEQLEMLQLDFRRLGLNKSDNIHVHVGSPLTATPIEDLSVLLDEIKPVLVVVDTLFLFAPVKSLDSYQEVNAVLARVRKVARDTGSHLIAIHHTSKPSKDRQRSGPTTILGSNAIHGAVDNALTIALEGEHRFLSTSQRGGKRFYNHEILFDDKTGTYTLGLQREEY